MLFLCSVSILGIIWNYDYNIQGNNSCYAKILLPHIRILKVFVKTYKVWPTVAWGIFLMCNHGMLCGGGGWKWTEILFFLQPLSLPLPLSSLLPPFLFLYILTLTYPLSFFLSLPLTSLSSISSSSYYSFLPSLRTLKEY